MSNLILIPENILAMDAASVYTPNYASTSMIDENMLTESPSEFWRSSNNKPSSSQVTFYPNDSHQLKAQAFAAIGHNLADGDQYRVMLSDTMNPGNPYTELVAPNSTIAQVNTTSAYTAINDGSLIPLGTFAVATADGTPWSLHVGFATPANAPAAGANLQAFWIYVKANAAIDSGASAPSLKCELYEGGVLKADLGTKRIKSSTGQWVFFSWNAALLGTANGSAVECKLTATPNSNYFIGSGGATVMVDLLSWTCEKSGEHSTVTDGDTGWLTHSENLTDSISYLSPETTKSRAILVQFASTMTFRTAILLMRSDWTKVGYDPLTEVLPTPPGYVQIGTVILGETWSPAADRDFGPLVSTKDYSSKSRTYGGQRFGSRRFVQRILSIPLNWLTPAEAHTLFDRILWRHGILKPIFVSILPGDATEEKHTSFLASLRNPENAMVATTTRGKSRAMTLEFEEEL